VVNYNSRSGYATGRRTIAITRRLIDDNRRGNVPDPRWRQSCVTKSGTSSREASGCR
jgi:hypothetical protein